MSVERDRRSAMRNLRAHLHELDPDDRAALRAALDQADEDLKPPPPPPPPKAFAAVELLDWRFHSNSIRTGSMPNECTTRHERNVPISQWRRDDSIQVNVGNLGVEVRVRGRGEFRVLVTADGYGRRRHEPEILWVLKFDTPPGTVADATLPLTSVSFGGRVRFVLWADPRGWAGGE